MSISHFSKLFEQLNGGHERNFDPVRFAFIQSLSERLSLASHQSNNELIEKALATAELYLIDLNDNRLLAAKTVEQVSAEFSDQAELAAELFKKCQFKQLEQLRVRLLKERTDNQNIDSLRQLTKNLNQLVSADDAKQSSFDEVLYQQEQHARSPGESLGPQADGRGEQLVMQSMKHYRESMKHFNIDKIIERAINDGPLNPGPLNPQMLAIRSLTHMRDLSPQYLRRFAAYIESLLWLEKKSTRLNAKQKKPQ